jgi:hypothetical protein
MLQRKFAYCRASGSFSGAIFLMPRWIANWRPISTTISLGRRKYSIASLELRNRKEYMPLDRAAPDEIGYVGRIDRVAPRVRALKQGREIGDLSFRAWPGLWDDQHLSGEDSLRLHDHNVNDRPLHALDTALACGRGIRHRGRPSVWKLLSQLEPACIPVLGSLGQLVHSAGKGGDPNSS